MPEDLHINLLSHWASTLTMASYGHTYDAACVLQAESNQFTRRASEVSTDPQKIRAQFFYSSALPIDDPLSPIPPPSSSSTTGPSKVPPQPFSVRDNNALEAAWQIIQRSMPKIQEEEGSELGQVANSPISSDHSENLTPRVDDITTINKDIKDEELTESRRFKTSRIVTAREGTKDDISLVGRDTNPILVTSKPLDKHLDEVPHMPAPPDLTLVDDPDYVPFDDNMPVGSEEIGNDEFESGIPRRRHRSPFHRREKPEKLKIKDSAHVPRDFQQRQTTGNEALYGSSPLERDTTGTPFVRAASRLRRSRSRALQRPNHDVEAQQTDEADSGSESGWARLSRARASSSRHRPDPSETKRSESSDLSGPNPLNHKSTSEKAYITVGTSRLHVVELPELKVSNLFK